jgi:large subunit ribosomal protein L20
MRVKRGVASHRKHLKIRKATKGMSHSRRRSVRMGRQGVIKSLQYSYRDRRNKKRTFRALWNSRINAAARSNGVSYSQLINSLKKAKIALNRKILADLAVNEPKVFEQIIKESKAK